MINVVTFHEHTISAFPYLLGDCRWGAAYTVCLRGEIICHSKDVPRQGTAQLAEDAAIGAAIRYVEGRLALLGLDYALRPRSLHTSEGS